MKKANRKKSATLSFMLESEKKKKFQRFQAWVKYGGHSNPTQADLFDEGSELLYKQYGFEQMEVK